MAKKKQSSALNRFEGKKVVFSGKFDYGAGESLKSMAQSQQATVSKDLTGKVDYLVLPDLNTGKTIQKKAEGLNRKGATIQVMDAVAFRTLVMPTQEELLTLLKQGEAGAKLLKAACPSFSYFDHGVSADCPRLVGAKLDGLDLSGFNFNGLAFVKCSFNGATLNDTSIEEAIECDFSKATGESTEFGKIDCSRFKNAQFSKAEFDCHLAGSDFRGAKLEKCEFTEYLWGSSVPNPPSSEAPQFTKAILHGCVFDDVHLEAANFDECNLEGTSFHEGSLKGASFRKAKARDAIFVAACLQNADLSNAMLAGANLAEADLTGATFDGANVTNANFLGAKLPSGALKSVRGVPLTEAASVGPALTELDSIFDKAKNAKISLRVSKQPDERKIELQISIYSHSGSHNAYSHVLKSYDMIAPNPSGTAVFSQQILQLGRVFGNYQIHYEELEVSSTKSPKGGKELRKLVMQGIAEAFGQEIPAEDVLAAAAKTHRDAKREKGAAERERREKEKAEAEKQKEKAKKQIAKKVEKAVGKVTDIASFLKALEVRIEKPKIDKATKMLKASGFKLFNDVTDQFVSGVVKSQTDPDLVYACRVDHEGHYSCCTQNLNVCGGLRGSICKHLLVLIVGLVQAGELDPTTIDAWIAKTHNIKADLDKENMGAIFIKYKGAEAGEVDWRPTETVPEDYYAL